MYKKSQITAASRGDIPMDTVIRNVNLVNVFTAEIYRADIGIKEDVFAGVARYQEGKPAYEMSGDTEIDGSGKYAVPGFIDCHVHIESTMVTPENFVKALIERGTTAAVIDPHEIANVLGVDGVKYMIDATKDMPVDIFITIPSAVPAVPGLETSGAVFEAEDIGSLLEEERVVGIAEIMDYIGVINQSDRMAGIIDEGLKRGVCNEGHLPRTVGRHLDTYMAAGVDSDHESRSADEIIEKLRQGMTVYIRESSVSQFADIAADAWREVPYAANIAMCTDDVEASDMYQGGQMNRVVRRCIEEGIPAPLAVRYASLNGAQRYQLKHRGGIGPGYSADFSLVDSLEKMDVTDVFTKGIHQVKDGRMIHDIQSSAAVLRENTVKIPDIKIDDFHITTPDNKKTVSINTMEMTKIGTTERGTLDLETEDGIIRRLPEGYLFASVIGRHGQGDKPFTGVLKNAGLSRGAYATTLSHDSHNLIVVGTNAEDMYHAAKYLESTGGGLVLFDEGELQAAVDLPVAGLMADSSVETLAPVIFKFNETSLNMGVKVGRRAPSMAMSSLALTVIPEIRLSNLGLVDVKKQELIPLFIEK
ncbi:adenine deaminase [Corticicoccus populi]|uniref:Adenine deaminase n=1 Tax=Corticicoccus populi TaxID=1812821 RepID=A0ABW5WXK9_9STAP